MRLTCMRCCLVTYGFLIKESITVYFKELQDHVESHLPPRVIPGLLGSLYTYVNWKYTYIYIVTYFIGSLHSR